MFLAGILPGILLMLILYAVVLIMPEGRIRSKKKYTWREKGRILYEVIPLLGVPVVILGGIYGGIATPVEAAALACIYAAIIGCFVYRQLTWQGMIKSLRISVRTTSMIFVLVAMAYGVNAVVTMLGVPTALASIALGLGKMGILLMVMGIMLLIGFMLEEISTMVVMVPIFWPSLLKLGVDPLQFGVVICTAAAIGYCTPPIALNLYTAASVANVSSTAVFRKVIPFLIGLVVLNLITVFVPQVSTWLPYLVYHR
jgi:C4-dicarboxylate transporter DctM subunit